MSGVDSLSRVLQQFHQFLGGRQVSGACASWQHAQHTHCFSWPKACEEVQPFGRPVVAEQCMERVCWGDEAGEIVNKC